MDKKNLTPFERKKAERTEKIISMYLKFRATLNKTAAIKKIAMTGILSEPRVFAVIGEYERSQQKGDAEQ
jgi:hypothetical protein